MSRVYAEPTGLWHRVVSYAVEPDRQRPGYRDARVVATACGVNVAVIGLRKNRPPVLSPCSSCFGGVG